MRFESSSVLDVLVDAYVVPSLNTGLDPTCMDGSIREMCALVGVTWGWRLDSDNIFKIPFGFVKPFFCCLTRD